MYNFDRYINRKNTDCLKWDILESRYGYKDLIPLWVADGEFEAPKEVVEALIERAKHPIYGYGLRSGEYYLSLVDWVKKRHNWDIKREWVMFSPGVVPALAMFVKALTKEGDKILVQSPVYNPFYSVIEGNGRIIVKNELVRKGNRFEIDFDDLEEKLSNGVKLFLFCNPQNPTGRVWTREELEKVAALCVKYNVYVASDDIHCDIVYKPNKYIPLASLNPEIEKLCAVCMAPSKTFNVAGLASSGIIIPNENVLQKYYNEMEAIENDLGNVFGHVAFSECYRHGEQYIDELLVYLKSNRDYIVEFVNKNIPQIKCIVNEGTYLILLDFEALGLEGEKIQEFLAKEAGIAVKAGYVFGDSVKYCARINYACRKETIIEAMDKIKIAVDKYISK